MRNWTYEHFPRHSHPHGITFTRCATSGAHFYGYCESAQSVQWQVNPQIVDWLTQQFGSANWTYDPLVPYAVNFTNKADAMLFKLTHSAGAV